MRALQRARVAHRQRGGNVAGMTTASATSPALDLSSLPAPDIVTQIGFEAILAELVAEVQAIWPEFSALVESDPLVKLLQLFAYREMVIRQDFNDRAKGVLVAFARGADLDHIAAWFALTRMEITPADPEAGTPAVMESDDDLRRRVLLAPETWCVAGPTLAYVGRALAANPDVLDASATSPAPGEVVIAVLSRTGAGIPAPEVLAAVDAACSADDVRPLTDAVTVQAADVVEYQVEAALTLFAGPDPETIVAAALASVQAYAEKVHRMGQDVPRSALIAALHVGGVKQVQLLAPLADITCTPLQAPAATAFDLSIAGFD